MFKNMRLILLPCLIAACILPQVTTAEDSKCKKLGTAIIKLNKRIKQTKAIILFRLPQIRDSKLAKWDKHIAIAESILSSVIPICELQQQEIKLPEHRYACITADKQLRTIQRSKSEKYKIIKYYDRLLNKISSHLRRLIALVRHYKKVYISLHC